MISVVLSIVLAAKKVGVPASLMLSLCFHESGLRNITKPNDGGSPTYGVCQVKLPAGREAYRFTKHPELKVLEGKSGGKALTDVHVNALASAGYMKFQLDRYKGDIWKAVSAYNKGSYSTSNRAYVEKVLGRVRGGMACIGKCSKIQSAQKKQPIRYWSLLDWHRNRL